MTLNINNHNMKKLLLSFITVTAILTVGCEPESPKVEVTGVSLSKTALEMEIGDSQSLTATIAPDDASDKKLAWTSDEETVAKVDQSGKVTAVSAGTANIIVICSNGKSASCKVTVKAKNVSVESISLDDSELSLVETETKSLTATITPSDATDKKLTWTSSNESVATVDQSGKVTAVSAGIATITATSNNGKTATCAVTVKVKTIAVTGVAIKDADGKDIDFISFVSGDVTVAAEVSPSNATNKNIIWSISNANVLEITVTSTVHRINGIKEGYAVLTATSEDGGWSDKCLVSVGNSSTVFKGNLNIPTVAVPAGYFTMGSPEEDEEAIYGDEFPQHKVTLSKSFNISKYEVTNYQFAEFLNAKNIGSDGVYNGSALVYSHEWGVQYNSSSKQWQSALNKELYPIVNVTWFGANEFAAWAGGRLPTEAEWEYACRAGSTTPYYWGSTSDGIDEHAWCLIANISSSTHPVGQLKTNAWGLYDVAGNVLEWCADWYKDNYYTASPITDPKGPSTGSYRVARSGAHYLPSFACRSTARNRFSPTAHNNYLGFRVVFD